MNKFLITLSVVIVSAVLGVGFATNALSFPTFSKILGLSLVWAGLAFMSSLITWLNTEQDDRYRERTRNKRLALSLIAPTIFGIVWVVAMILP